MDNHRLPIFSSDGKYCVKHLPLKAILAQVELGSVVPYHTKTTSQWRMASSEARKPEPPSSPSPSAITWIEMEALVGCFGPRAQTIARAKVNAWSEIHDTKAVCICAGKVCRPE